MGKREKKALTNLRVFPMGYAKVDPKHANM